MSLRRAYGSSVGGVRSARARTAGRLDDALFVAVGASWGAGLIHIQATLSHLDEHVPFALAFALLAALQLAWGLAVYHSPTSRLLWAGVLLSISVIGVWVVSRTTGVPIGPQPWQPEPWGAPDVLASADEAVLCLLVLAARWGRGARGLRGAIRMTAVGIGVALVSLSSASFMLGGHN